MVLVIQTIHNPGIVIIYSSKCFFFLFVCFCFVFALFFFFVFVFLFCFVLVFVFSRGLAHAKCNNVIVPFRARWKLTL